jgi:hypothetical protein
VFNGKETSASNITYVAVAPLRVGDYQEKEVVFLLIKLAEFPIVLGLLWLSHYHVTIKCHIPALVFDKDYCQDHIV